MAIERLVPETVYERLPSGARVADIYSQVVRASGTTRVHVAGTIAVDADGDLVGPDDMAAQTRQVMAKLGASLAAADADPSDVVRIRIYTVDVDRFVDEGMGAVVEFFGEDRPANTLLGVERLADPDFLVEIDATAEVSPPSGP